MTVVDLHPEELLDKDARGELSADELARLETHLARCAACRAERVLRLDFADELEADDRPSALLGLVQGALAAPRPAAPPNAMPELDAVPGLRRRPRRTAFVLLVAAAVLAASAAGATGMTGRVWSRLGGGSLEATHSTATVSPTSAPALSATDAAHARARGSELTADGAGPGSAPATEPDAIVPTAIVPTAIEPAPTVETARAAAPAVRVVASAPAAAVAPVVAVVPVVAPAVAPVPTTASGLFESANAARRSGDTVTALARYDALESQFPSTREAHVAKATTGKLLLDRGDSASALARFDAYLASGAAELREEAMAGRATALERLLRGDEESRAWEALVATYPGTPYGTHARARIAASSRRSLPQ